MSTAAVQIHDTINPTDDQRETCACGKEIRWCDTVKKWFHIHNFMTFGTPRIRAREVVVAPEKPTNSSGGTMHLRLALRCGFVSRENRKTQADFVCISCGYSANADYVGSVNVLARTEPSGANVGRLSPCVA